jgi:erythromycin esterase-like protein
MKKIISVLCSLFFLSGNAQNFNPKILTLSENIEDFSFLKEELKGVQVVMLGENTHSDGNVFEMKTNIVKYLHQEMGFNTVAFESGIYDVWKAQKSIDKGEKARNAFENSLFTIWSKRKEFQSFIDFFDQNKANLKLFGFDNQISGKYGEKELIKDLYDYCNQNKLKLKLDRENLELLMESMLYGVFDEGDITYDQYETALNEILNKITKTAKIEEQFYWTQIIKSLLTLGEERYLSIQNPSSFYVDSKDNIRDKQMADNLLAYIKNHPNEKIICWGANQHFTNDVTSISTPILKEYIPMGSYIKNSLKEKVYSLAAVTAADSIYMQNKWYKTPLNEASFEYHLKKNKSPHLFISSNQPEMKKIQLNRLFSPETFIEARLDLLYDGYLYFNSIKESTPIDEIRTGDSTRDMKIIDVSEIERKKINNIVLQNETKSDSKTIALNEIVVYSKKTPYEIINKTINNFEKNYPEVPFTSKMYTNLSTDIQDTTHLNFSFISNQYEDAYSNIYRSTKQLKEIKWDIKNGYEPQNLREFHSLMYNNPIKYAPLLNIRKFKKFLFTLEEIKKYNGQEVYVITFSTKRDHSNFTKRVYLSNYSGTLYINKNDYAVVKTIENWEVTKFPVEFKEGFNLNGMLAKYTKKEFVNETIETDFIKINDLYFISHSEIEIVGKLLDFDNKSVPFKTTINSFWSDFNTQNPERISNKDEQHVFAKINYNKTFWEAYKFPK